MEGSLGLNQSVISAMLPLGALGGAAIPLPFPVSRGHLHCSFLLLQSQPYSIFKCLSESDLLASIVTSPPDIDHLPCGAAELFDVF